MIKSSGHSEKPLPILRKIYLHGFSRYKEDGDISTNLQASHSNYKVICYPKFVLFILLLKVTTNCLAVYV